jgi:omega-3 fatty acid desaturase (delta-15 desaturase)
MNKIMKSMPTKVFEKSLLKSSAYMAFDLLMWGVTTILMNQFVKSSVWMKLPILLKAVSGVVYWNLSGFFMWCIFVIGHDCGHTTFSNYKWVNDIIGHITHSSLLVPFYPWQLSHRRHHMFHNHIDKDYSYIWYTPERMNAPQEKIAKLMHDYPLLLFFYPFIGWQFYLLGINDGSHFIPFESGRMWQQTPDIEKRKCLISAISVVTAFTSILALNGFNLKNFAFYYLAPHVVFSWWLVCVTYLQHHGPKTQVYTEKTWSYVRAAFETVDRTFGKGIDWLHHHITDGHVAHHLFFTQIPHYNLPMATQALKDYLSNNGLSHLYRHEDTQDFPIRLHKDMLMTGFRAEEAPELVA